jgi:hypothetical protein
MIGEGKNRFNHNEHDEHNEKTGFCLLSCVLCSSWSIICLFHPAGSSPLRELGAVVTV